MVQRLDFVAGLGWGKVVSRMVSPFLMPIWDLEVLQVYSLLWVGGRSS